MSQYDDIVNKYKNHFYHLLDNPAVDTQVVYLPSNNSMAYTIGDNAYDYFGFTPGDIMTIKEVKKRFEYENFNCVYVKENKCTFTPAELVSLEYVDKKDIAEIKRLYSLLKKDFDSAPKPNVKYGPEYKGPTAK